MGFKYQRLPGDNFYDIFPKSIFCNELILERPTFVFSKPSKTIKNGLNAAFGKNTEFSNINLRQK